MRHFTILLTILLAACSTDNSDQYLGVWEEPGNKHHLIQISKAGEQLVFSGARVTQEGLNTESGQKIVLTQQNGLWIGPMNLALALSDDEKTLFFGGDSYIRADKQRIEAIRLEQAKAAEEYTRQQAEREAELKRKQEEGAQKSAIALQNREACGALSEQQRKEQREIRTTYSGFDQRRIRQDKLDVLNTTYQEKKKKIPNCFRGL